MLFLSFFCSFVKLKNSKMTSLKEGDKAPNFSVLNQDDKLLTLDTYKGKKLILYFYPKDSTPGCTAESCNLRDNYSELLDLGYDVLGVSADNSTSHKKFIAKNELPFHLLSPFLFTGPKTFILSSSLLFFRWTNIKLTTKTDNSIVFIILISKTIP